MLLLWRRSVAELRAFDFEIAATSLSDDDEQKLRDALAAGSDSPRGGAVDE